MIQVQFMKPFYTKVSGDKVTLSICLSIFFNHKGRGNFPLHSD